TTAVLYTLSLHDALPICSFSFRRFSRSFRLPEPVQDTSRDRRRSKMGTRPAILHLTKSARFHPAHRFQEGRVAATANLWARGSRSEEHTSELQSLAYLVC